MRRDAFTMPLDLGAELIVDNFAGGGGASTGIEQAFGRPVDIAINHDGEALAMHAANHPTTRHFREDVFTVHPGFVTRQQPIGLAWFSPDCTHHSKAKGGKPREQKIRGLAWVALKWATFQAPRCIALENVEEFADWGPLDAHGNPIKAERGRTFRAFVAALSTGLPEGHPDAREIFETLGADFPMSRLHRGLGYRVEYRVLRACDFGARTIRKRLYLFARRDGLPIMWPEVTHGDPASRDVRKGKLKPWRTAAECIDWTIPCPSIFERKRPLKDATLRRIARGLMKFVIDTDDPFIVPAEYLAGATLIQAGYGERPGQAPRVPGLDKPIGTVVAGGGKHALVTAFLAKHYGGVTGTRIDVPAGTVTTVDHHAIVTAQLVGCGGRAAQSRPRDVGEPTATITAKADTALAVSHLIKLSQNSIGQDPREPLHTVMAGAARFGEVRAFLIKFYSHGGQWQDPRDPMHTIPTRDRLGLVTIHGEDYAIVDIGMRMLTPRELARAQGFPDSYVLDPVSGGKPLSKSAQVRMIGNSVCPDVAAALIRANFAHERQLQQVVV
ncbi:DNA cytosine methyltransferase [Burkholderia cenocepacia]|uniref:DNA cytosine methyltransferase n=1 Tax=Burkholderia cenocepacia TaxID=95486 RepID=UPI0022373FF1|nr:DNA cytosine methyltransferase [Burkholderia cenocepacia]MCW5141076.1 DNA cytosine methyltransferase [Burkholderia cenocepacia]